MAAGRVARAARALDRFFFGPAPLHGLVAARILLATGLLVIYARRLPYAQEMFGPEGLGGSGFHQRFPGAPPINPHISEAFTWILLLPSETLVWTLYGALLAACVAFALGARTRLSGAMLLALHLLFYARNPFVYEGSWAEFIHMPLLYTVVAPTGRHWSVDAWRARRSGAPAASWLATAVPLRLFQIQITTMYVAAAWSRLDLESWLLGEVVFNAAAGATHGRYPGIDWTPWKPLLALGTWGALALEVAAPIALWIPRLRQLCALGLIGLHLGIELLTNVGGWNFVMISGALCFLLPLRPGDVRDEPGGG